MTRLLLLLLAGTVAALAAAGLTSSQSPHAASVRACRHYRVVNHHRVPCVAPAPVPVPVPTPTPTPTPNPQPGPGKCHQDGNGVFAGPDRSCTPGMWISDPAIKNTPAASEFDPNVSDSHVCAKGYNPRPGVDVSGPLKQQALGEYGEPASLSSSVEADHLFPRWLGGATALENFWPEPDYANPVGFDHNPKDKLEFAVYNLTCGSHQLTVAQARSVFEGDWRVAYEKYVGPLTPGG